MSYPSAILTAGIVGIGHGGPRMDRSRVAELHYIAPVANLASMARWGLVSHNMAERVPHSSVAAAEIQDRRVGKPVPGGLQLHDYVNTYFHARNPMMSRLQYYGCPPIVVLRVSAEILDLPGAVISDGNAASGPTRFFAAPDGLERLNEERVFAAWWTDPDEFAKAEKKRQRCAEVLIPHRIGVEFLQGAYVCDEHGEQACRLNRIGWEVNNDIFFK
jgi:hypothetical protein